MKKLIIYDESCPMCRLYTKGMVAADSSGCLNRLSNNQITNDLLINQIDKERARHEIPMIDLDGGETLYGVDTWTYALGQHNPQVEKLLSVNWLRAILQKLYAFISYNRRIIVTSAPGRWQLLDLQPDFRLSYRLAFVLLVLGVVSSLHYAVAGSFVWPVFGLLGGQLSLVSLYLRLTKQTQFLETLLDYTGHLAMSLLLGGIVMATGLALNWPASILIGGTLAISQHFIRTYRLGLNPWLSASFTLLYLLIVLS
ncbi:thiol-disulfide oxidoreductase DCC family protein [Spirosoma areae]